MMAATQTSTSSGVATAGVESAYEDMFKEITRKLYGTEAGHGLHGTPVACQVATSGHLSLPEGERSFTTLISDRPVPGNTIEFANDLNGNKDHLFGLAALMQNGFTQAPILAHNFSPNAAGTPALTNEDVSRWTGTANATDNCADLWSQPTVTGKPPGSSKAIKKEADTKRTSQDNGNVQGSKRYTCSSCPYSTDRRDLYTRHENIHKTEKPFNCYICLKQFNRADHVKKHFLRMHRDLQYDINKTRRTAPGRASTSSTQPTNTVQAPSAPSVAVTVTPTNTEYYGPPPTTNYQGQGVVDHSLAGNASDMGPQMVHHQQAAALAQLQSLPVTEHPVKVKQEKPLSTTASFNSGSPPKKKGDKRFVCCYCPWTGADNWGLKRHLNTHTKPYVCVLCDYKAARPERLVTHVYKVHNKKACNKCSFLADDHAQFLVHQSEAHPADSRPGQGNGTGNHNPGSVLQPISTGNGSVAQSMDLFGNGFNSGGGPAPAWRPTPTTQKRGAERLFQYMEADGSDAEDYQKQLQMTALSRSGRNTVAQDFHKAGGGVTTTSTKQQESSRSSDAAGNTTSLFANKGYQQKFIRDLEEFIVQRLTTGSHANVEPEAGKSISTINTPPPAKRSRCSTHHDKENQNQGQAAAVGKVPRVKATEMRDIFQMMVQHYGAQLRTADEQTKRGKSESLEELERILQNNHELTISIKENESTRASACIKYSNGDSGLDDEEEEEEQSRHLDCTKSSKRKQFVPRKIDPERDNLAVWNSIRDKHLSRLMSTKKSCRVCVQRQSSLNIPHHSVSSLILHQRYRHWKPLKQCDLCSAKFKQPYQLHLHRKFQHRAC